MAVCKKEEEETTLCN